jgi:hypothetical protein
VITLNQIADQFSRIATAHKDINSYGFGDMWEISLSGDVKYPQLFVVPQPATFGERQIDFSFNVLVMDRVNKGERGETDALSDTNQILGDVLALLDHPDYEWTLQKNISSTPFTESFDDELTGWNATIILSVPFSYNRCAVPTDSININFDNTNET